MKKLFVDSYESFMTTVNECAGKSIICLFTGSKDEKGQSWCPDCNVAEPVIDKVINNYSPDTHVLITVVVGDRPTWKNPNNPYRTTKNLKISCVPTLLKWGTSIRLEESQCAKEELIAMLVEE